MKTSRPGFGPGTGPAGRASSRSGRAPVPAAAALLSAIAILTSGGASPAQDAAPIARFTVRPAADGARVTVEAVLKLEGLPIYLKDFGQLEEIRWTQGERDLAVASERRGDLLVFKGLPSFGEAQAVYALRCVTEPRPGYRKRLMGGPGFVMAREGLYLGVNGREASPVEVRWSLPPGWSLALGWEGVRSHAETQRALWIAGEVELAGDEKVDGKTFRLSVLKGVPESRAPEILKALSAVFRRAWADCGPLGREGYGIAVMPRGAIGGGTALGLTLAGEDDLATLVHEMLHWWSDPRLPAWFREGVHTYVAGRILLDLGQLGEDGFRAFLDGLLAERARVVEREGRIATLAESSAAYEKPGDGSRPGGGDIYALAPLLAYKLDREIRAANPSASLWKVFAAACRGRDRGYDEFGRARPIDLAALIKAETGYDPGSLFKRYFDAPVKDAAVLLR